MIRINLLPHREEKRKARRQQFYGLLGLVAALAGVIVFLVYSIIGGYISTQEAKNDFLSKEIADLDKKIDEIKRLKEQTQALLARKQIIESLQRDRAEAVRLLSELVKQMPEGVYVRSIKQEGVKISLAGYAQSSARVSTLMRNIEASPWLEKPQLIEIKAATVDKRRLNEFSLNAALKRAPVEDGGKKK
ncbi:PilN domain-containing protein [Propionivibrio sp.]|uniref:PilN domain-containing protein n=1 Tax=Propionivibrio sp. TaxID=2212460 RepID=UPI0025D3D407|nr:PilN domain-containing protein [Propionivibrio sp.]MBK7355035.1 PilN domain-containing protein [Propionivibrio sp.]MBK8402405.1 PilN domain-containing protein [Propionivibrio sp.]MBK8743559.1 PilN domain-containing protein [Propionivibrio sp.]MBK8892863.1 PilN domain-containing protein [Propionivibrio sp.]MBL0206474.1 PilN domain-containing protein [Propionivibrio sp.]